MRVCDHLFLQRKRKRGKVSSYLWINFLQKDILVYTCKYGHVYFFLGFHFTIYCLSQEYTSQSGQLKFPGVTLLVFPKNMKGRTNVILKIIACPPI